ncbi:MAG: hypothetical protein OXS47_11185 [Chloroflexota bacterium]|nr:hypothetical protein [Chloroflexota bacterium]
MALSQTRPSTTSRAGIALAALGILAVVAGCSGDPELLADLACQEEHLPEGLERLTFGNLSRSEMGREVGAAPLDEAGVEGGYFAYWKERRDSLEDDPAVEIVCQVVAFGDDGEASRFVSELPAHADWLSVTVAGIALAEGTGLTELAAEGARAFRLDETDGRIRYAVVVARDRFVLSVHLGGPEGEVSVEAAVAILETMGR